MDHAQIMKRKAVELAKKLQTRFPAQLLFVLPAIESMPADEILHNYIISVHSYYSQRIKQRDESFFMTTSDLDDPMNMVGMLRGLWGKLSQPDKDSIWKYMDVFEKLASASSRNGSS